MSDLAVLRLALDQAGCGGYVSEYAFHPRRRWRFDLAWPQYMLAVEYEGGLYQRGWHQSIQRYASDCQKYTAAALLGWRVLRYTAADSVEAIVSDVRTCMEGCKA